MTSNEFNSEWNSGFGTLSGQGTPNYDEFSVSERMLEDYLDIFRGENSRNEAVLMPYPHPFFDSNGKPLLHNKPSIKYVLIGEARPKSSSSLWKSCSPFPGDEGNSYFYNVLHVKRSQPWLSSARTHWGAPAFRPCPKNKIQTLLNLAENGVLLLDLFPFAIKYTSKIREDLNNSGKTRSYWDALSNPYSLHNRLNSISSLLCADWDLTLVAPCIISEYIVNPANGFPTLAIANPGLHPHTFRTILFDKNRCISCSKGHEWKKIAVAQQGPTARLLGLSF